MLIITITDQLVIIISQFPVFCSQQKVQGQIRQVVFKLVMVIIIHSLLSQENTDKHIHNFCMQHHRPHPKAQYRTCWLRQQKKEMQKPQQAVLVSTSLEGGQPPMLTEIHDL